MRTRRVVEPQLSPHLSVELSFDVELGEVDLTVGHRTRERKGQRLHGAVDETTTLAVAFRVDLHPQSVGDEAKAGVGRRSREGEWAWCDGGDALR